jgi:hypothetical protein
MYRVVHSAWYTDERLECIRALTCEWARVTQQSVAGTEWVCQQCRRVPQLKAFRQRLLRYKPPSVFTNDAQLSRTDLLRLKQQWTTNNTDLRWRVTRLAVQLARSKIKLMGAHRKLSADMERGDVAAVTHGLRRMHKKGAFKDATPQLQMALDALASLCAPNRGARPTTCTRELVAVLQAEFGPACVKLVAGNLGLGSATSSERWIKDDRRQFKMGIRAENFADAATIMTAHMKRLNIKPPVLHEVAEDETAVQHGADYHAPTDCLVGFCGPVCSKRHHIVGRCKCVDRHKCCVNGDGSILLGPSLDNDPSVYNAIVNAFKTQKIATQGRVMLITPHHPDLPKLVIMWAPTCGALNAKDVEAQWDEVDELLRIHLEPIGLYQTGKASDGASTRRKPQYARMTSTEGTRYGIKGIAGFTLTGRTLRREHQLVVADVHIQDYIHCGKKWITSTDSATREMMVGAGMAHMHSIVYMIEKCEAHEHRLWQSDGTRRGKNAMNWSSVVRLISDTSLNCLQRLADDPRHGLGVRAMLWFLRLLRRYISLFVDQTLTPLERIGGAWYVIIVLRCWRLWILKHDTYTLAKNFLTGECFQDVIMSCFALILTIMALRDFSDSGQVYMWLTGSDAAEAFFAGVGSMAGNRRVYTFMEAHDQIVMRNYIESIRARGNVKFPTRNRALVTDLKIDGPRCDVPMTASDVEIKAVMDAQELVARQHVIDARMGPPEGKAPEYWTHPHLWESGNRRAETLARMYSQDREDADMHESLADGDVLDDAEPDMETDMLDEVAADEVAAEAMDYEMDDGAEQKEEVTDPVCDDSGGEHHISTMWHPGQKKRVWKRAVIATINRATYSGKVSSDRVMRYTSPVTGIPRDADSHRNLARDSWKIGLFDDVAVKFRYVSDTGEEEIAEEYGRVFRIKKQTRTKKTKTISWIEYRRPVDLSPPNLKRESDVYLTVHWYSRVPGDGPARYVYDTYDHLPISLEEVICPVDMKWHAADGTFSVDVRHTEVVRDCIVDGATQYEYDPSDSS